MRYSLKSLAACGSLAAAFALSVFTAFAANPDFPNLEEVIIATKCHLDVGYTATVPEGMKAGNAQSVNLRGEIAGEPIAVEDGAFSFDLGAWAPKSFIFSDATEQTEEACRCRTENLKRRNGRRRCAWI